MTSRKLGPVLLALILFILTIFYMRIGTEFFFDRIVFKPGLVEAMGSSQNEIIFQGTLLQKKALSSPDILPVYGSSELSAKSEFHPWEMFDGKKTGWVPFLIGRGGSQDLVHVLSLAAQGESLRGKKVAIILSAQWFTPEGLSEPYLAQNFSALQTYRILYNPTLPDDVKREIIGRLLEFPKVLQDYPILYVNLQNYQASGWQTLPERLGYSLLGRMELASLEIRDLVKTMRLAAKINPQVSARNAQHPSPFYSTLDWDRLRQEAVQRGKESASNNNLGILNSYYLQYVKPNLANSAGADKLAKLYPSKEYQDLGILLKVLKAYEAKALFIIVPVNGYWYDYTGFPRQERQAYYARVAKQIKAEGFEVASFADHEYDKYFLQDIMHLGWKGWVYVNEAMDRFYHQRD